MNIKPRDKMTMMKVKIKKIQNLSDEYAVLFGLTLMLFNNGVVGLVPLRPPPPPPPPSSASSLTVLFVEILVTQRDLTRPCRPSRGSPSILRHEYLLRPPRQRSFPRRKRARNLQCKQYTDTQTNNQDNEIQTTRNFATNERPK